MYFLRSCSIIYEDWTTKEVNECDGIMSIFSMPNVSGTELLIFILCVVIILYFLLKILLLLDKDIKIK